MNSLIQNNINQKGFVSLWLIGALVVVLGIGGYVVSNRSNAKQTLRDKIGIECSKSSGPKEITEECGNLLQEFRTKYGEEFTTAENNVAQENIQPPKPVSIGETSDWKTYTNSKYGFEFQYPSDKIMINPSDGVDYENTILLTKSSESVVLTIGVDKNPTTESESCEKEIGKFNFLGIVPAIKCRASEPEDRWKAIFGVSTMDLVFYCWFPGQNDQLCDQILSTFKFTTTADQEWKNKVLNEFKNLSDWKIKDNNTEWNIVGMDSKNLDKFPKGQILTLRKSFNGKDAPWTEGEDPGKQLDQFRANESKLEASVKKSLENNGWKFTLGPTEGGFYQSYLYVKNGHPLILSTGTRNAVIDGMYVEIQFAY